MPEREPIPAGKGRIVALATDGLAQPAYVWVAVDDAAGESVTGGYTGNGEASFDLLPGDYTVSFRFAQEDSHSITVTAGGTTPVSSVARGRVVAKATDGLGEPAYVWVAVADAAGESVTGTYTGNGEAWFDLFPGDYSVTFRFEQRDSHPVTVVAGAPAPVGSKPRGRIVAKANDGHGEPTYVWVAVTGADDESVTGGYTGNGEASFDLLPGDYTVTFRFAQRDSHPVSVVASAARGVRSAARGRLAVNVMAADGLHGVRCWVDAIDQDDKTVASGFSDEHLGRIQFDLLPGKYHVNARSDPPSEADAEVVAYEVISAFARPRPPGASLTRAAGDAEFWLRGEGLEIRKTLRHERGVSIVGQLSTEIPNGRILSVLEGDSERAETDHGFYAVGGLEGLAIDPGMSPPTTEGAGAYVRALFRQGIVRDPSELPEALRALAGSAPVAEPSRPELDRAPIIHYAGSAEPWPGQAFTLWGDFPRGEIRVFFARNQEAPEDERREAAIIGRQRERLTVVVPEILGRCEVWCTRDGVRGPPYKTKIYGGSDDVPELDRHRDVLVLGVLGAAQPVAAPLVRLGYLLTRKRAHFTVPIGSKSGEIEVEGRRAPYRWVLFADVKLDNRFKDATFKLRLALYPGTPSIDGAAPPDPSFFVDVATVDIRKVDGQQIYEAHLIETALGPLVGATYNKDTKSVTVTHLATFELQKYAVALELDTEKKLARVALAIDESTKLDINGNEKGVVVGLTSKETRTIEGQVVHFERTHDLRDDRLETVLKLRAAETSSRPAFEGAVRFQDPEPDAPVSMFNVSTKIVLDHATLGFDADFKESRLDAATAAFSYADSDVRAGLNLSYKLDPRAEGQGRHRWSVGATGRTELFDGKVEIEGGVTGSVDLTGNDLRALEIGGNVEVAFEKLHFKLGGSGSYRVWRGDDGAGSRWSASIYGELEIAKVEARLGFTIGREGNKTDQSLDLALDFGGIIGSAVKTLSGEKDHKIDLWKRTDVSP